MKERLTRKYGPLPAWAWAAIGFVALFWYRNRGGSLGIFGGGSAAAAASTPTPDTSGEGTILQPGESMVGPGGSLVTAPGGISTPTSPIITTDPIEPVVPTSPTVPGTPSWMNQPPSWFDTPPAWLTKPPLSPKRNPKKKQAHEPKKHNQTTKSPKVQSKNKGRGGAAIRNALGGRFTKKGNATAQQKDLVTNMWGGARKRTVTPTASSGTRRSPASHGFAKDTAPTQRPTATHPKATSRPIIESPPRPSSPPPRNTRTPVRHPAPKPTRPR